MKAVASVWPHCYGTVQTFEFAIRATVRAVELIAPVRTVLKTITSESRKIILFSNFLQDAFFPPGNLGTTQYRPRIISELQKLLSV